MILTIICLILGLLPFVLGSFLTIPFWGEVVGLIIGSVVLAFLMLLGDKLMLAAIRAKKPLGSRDLVNIVNNLACRLGLEKVAVYISYDYPCNIYFMQPLRGIPSIVMGFKVLEQLSHKEVNALLLSALVRIKHGDARFRTVTSLVLGLFYFPFFVLLQTPLKRFSFIVSFLNFAIFPLRILRHLMLDNKEDLVRGDDEASRLLEDPSLLASAFFKLSQLDHEENQTLADTFMEDIALGENKKTDVLSSILRSNETPIERYLGTDS